MFNLTGIRIRDDAVADSHHHIQRLDTIIGELVPEFATQNRAASNTLGARSTA